MSKKIFNRMKAKILNKKPLPQLEEETKEDEIQTTIDTINKKFGKAIISSASLKKIEKNN